MKKVAFLSAVLTLCVCLSQAVGQPVQPNQPNNPNQPVMAVPQPQPAPQAQRQGEQPRKVKPVRRLPRNAQMEQARKLLGNKDYQNAHSVLMNLAQQGHAEAMFFLALMHERGNGVAQNPQEAIRWYTRSALGGWSDSMFNLGQRFYKGEAVQPDLAKAADLFFLVATTGDPDGQWAFGVLIAAGEGRPKDLIEGCGWLLLAANQGHEGAKKELQTFRQQMTAEQMGDAEAVAQTLDEMVKNDGFALEKMPAVPVPAFMADDKDGPNNENQNRQQTAEEEELIARVDMKGRVSATGDLAGRAIFTFDPQVYATIKGVVKDPVYFLRELSSSRADTELASDASAAYDDANSSVILDVHLLAVVRNRGNGRWEWLAEDQEFVQAATNDDGETVLTFVYKSAPSDEVKFEGNAVYTLPAGATDVAFDKGKNLVTYSLAHQDAGGKGRLDFRFDARDQIMSCLYKVYGLETDFPAQWVAKARVKNTGTGVITNLRLRYRVGGYSEWSMWQKFPEVLPGQTVVGVYKPVLEKNIAELTSTTPANVLVEWRYTDSDGKVQEDSDGERISILGRHEYVFSNYTREESMGNWYDASSNSAMIAAWVTRDDPVVKQFAAMANKAAGGKGAPYSDEAAYAVLKACYELWQDNDFTYQGPVGLSDPTLSFDNTIVQNMKFPRDVIRDKSGTCIELAALYCSMAHSVGLKPYIVLIPGHAFALIRLPSGNLLPVETTGVGGGKTHGSTPFDGVVQSAGETYKKAAAEGRVLEIDIEDCWTRGVSSPELAALPADILQRWNIVVVARRPSPRPAPGPVNPNPGPTPQPQPQPQSSPVGSWKGTATNQYPQLTYPMHVQMAMGQGGQFTANWYGEATMTDMYGRQVVYKITEVFVGSIQGDRLVMQGQSKTIVANGMQQQAPTDSMTVRLEGAELVGDVTLATGGRTTWRARRQ
jgi:Sel1 repeat